MARTNKKSRRDPANRRARIVSTLDGSRVFTNTRYRDPGSLTAEVATFGEKGSTELSVLTNIYGFIRFSGSEARTLYRTLQRHYDAAGRSI